MPHDHEAVRASILTAIDAADSARLDLHPSRVVLACLLDLADLDALDLSGDAVRLKVEQHGIAIRYVAQSAEHLRGNIVAALDAADAATLQACAAYTRLSTVKALADDGVLDLADPRTEKVIQVYIGALAHTVARNISMTHRSDRFEKHRATCKCGHLLGDHWHDGNECRTCKCIKFVSP